MSKKIFKHAGKPGHAVNEGEKTLIVAETARPAHLGQTLLDAMLEMGFDATLAVIHATEN